MMVVLSGKFQSVDVACVPLCVCVYVCVCVCVCVCRREKLYQSMKLVGKMVKGHGITTFEFNKNNNQFNKK